MAETTESTHGLDSEALEAAVEGYGDAFEASGVGLTDHQAVTAVLTAYFGALEPVGVRLVGPNGEVASIFGFWPEEIPDGWNRQRLYPGPVEEEVPRG